MWYIYTMEYYSFIKKNEIMSFAAIWMDLEIIILSEVRQRKTNIIRYCLYAESKKKWYKWTYLQKRLTDLEVTRRKGGDTLLLYLFLMFHLYLFSLLKTHSSSGHFLVSMFIVANSVTNVNIKIILNTKFLFILADLSLTKLSIENTTHLKVFYSINDYINTLSVFLY